MRGDSGGGPRDPRALRRPVARALRRPVARPCCRAFLGDLLVKESQSPALVPERLPLSCDGSHARIDASASTRQRTCFLEVTAASGRGASHDRSSRGSFKCATTQLSSVSQSQHDDVDRIAAAHRARWTTTMIAGPFDRTRRRRWRVAIALGFGVALAVLGCGDDDVIFEPPANCYPMNGRSQVPLIRSELGECCDRNPPPTNNSRYTLQTGGRGMMKCVR
jgi:hypothetical protein